MRRRAVQLNDLKLKQIQNEQLVIRVRLQISQNAQFKANKSSVGQATRAEQKLVLVSSFTQSKPIRKSPADILREEKDIRVKSVEEARRILESMPELRPGPGNRMPGLRGGRNTYRGDLINLKIQPAQKIMIVVDMLISPTTI